MPRRDNVVVWPDESLSLAMVTLKTCTNSNPALFSKAKFSQTEQVLEIGFLAPRPSHFTRSGPISTVSGVVGAREANPLELRRYLRQLKLTLAGPAQQTDVIKLFWFFLCSVDVTANSMLSGRHRKLRCGWTNFRSMRTFIFILFNLFPIHWRC